MSKKFNITGTCFPEDHYMADVSDKLEKIYALVETGEYFIINRPRQYGKTTTLHTLAHHFRATGKYLVFNLSFEGIGDAVFEDEKVFAPGFMMLLADYARNAPPSLKKWLYEIQPNINNMQSLSKVITELAKKSKKKIIVLIDEVDKSSNNQLFVSFLAMLRNKYLVRKDEKTFHAVVLAGVHDVKSLKLKIRPDEEGKFNSPWNIATDFKVDMNLHPFEIKPMLDAYIADKGVKMDAQAIAERLFYHTSGYPFLVSKLCKMLDEEILPTKTVKEWTLDDLDAAARQLVKESNTNFDSLTVNLENNKDLYAIVYKVAIEGEPQSFNSQNPTTNLGVLYGIFVEKNGRIAIHNRIYNELIVNYMADRLHQSQTLRHKDFGGGYRNDDNTLNMEALLLGFQAFMKKEYSKKDRDFLEKNGRLVFLAFVKPIINGSGYDFKEPQISEEQRLDVVITYFQHKYVAELKIWRGNKAHDKGLQQLHDYLDKQALDEGFLLVFDHSEVKNWHSEWINVHQKKVFVAWV